MEVEDVIRQYVVTLPRNVDILDTQKGSFACPQVDPNLTPMTISITDLTL